MTRLLPWLVGLTGLVACGVTAGPVATDSSPAETSATDTAVDLDCPRDQCGAACTDTRSDPDNCGACGRTCVTLNGSSTCEAGVCVLDTCEDGWGDCDGDVANGCETESDCVARAPCETTCGSTGSTACEDACAATCVVPVEQCNAIDDDCDGECDEGELPGCRASVYRSYGALGHVYGIDAGEAAGLGQTIERDPYFFVYGAESGDLVPLYRCDKGGGRRFLTRSSSCELGIEPELVVGWVSGSERCGAVPLYRLYNGSNHFYTLSAGERDSVVETHGYRYESVAAYVWVGP